MKIRISVFGAVIVLTTVVFLNVSGEYIPPGPKYTCPVRATSIYPCVCEKGSDIGLYMRCENSNLASLSVALMNVAKLNMPIEEMTLFKCKIRKLYGTLFHKQPIRKLFIIDTPIKVIDEFTFAGLNETLHEFHLIHSELEVFPKLAFKILGLTTVLNIDGHSMKSLDKDIFFESELNGRLEKLFITNGPLPELQVESFQQLRKLKTLDLHNNTLGVLKRNQFKGLRDLEILDISYNQIPKLESSHIGDLTKLSWLNVSHNALTELTRGAFARNSVLRVLNMAFNQIKRLDGNSFRGMRFLRRLYLSDNQIGDVGRGTFSSITRIGTIDLARNMIKKVDYQMFAQLNYVEILDIAENNITEIQKESFKDLYLTKINISYNAVEKIEAKSFINCANITLLDLSHNRIADIPKFTFDETTYANELQLSFNFLKNMSQIPLHNQTGIKILNVSHNEIVAIPKNTFPKLYELHTIDLSHNKLTEIHNAVLQPLFSLRSLNLSHNNLNIIKPPTFGTLPTLLEMDLSDNNLTDIAKGALTKLASLRFLNLENNLLEHIFQIPISLNYLNLNNNSIADIVEETWPVMNALLSININNNKLGNNLRGGSFSGLLTLQSLYLNNNKMTQIPWESLAGLTTLQYLHLAHNNITALRKGAFGKLPVVFELNLYNNQINNISIRAFDGLLQLLKLNLSSNSLYYIPNEAFIGLVSLRSLDLSHNYLEKLDNKTNGLLDDCLSLEKIDLSYNKISFITRKTFPSSPWIPYRLREIDLSFNTMPVLTYDLTFGTKTVKMLNLSNNNLNDIRKYIIGNLTSLEVLDLSHNHLSDLKQDNFTFVLPKNITTILLNDNELVNIPVREIVKVDNLTVLNLNENMLNHLERPLIDKIKKGVTVYFRNNPLKCDCSIRPLTHYLKTLTTPPDYYTNLKCEAPQFLTGQALNEIPDDRLTCVSDSANVTGVDYDVQPDLRFREISYSRNTLNAQWYVTSTRDIADFYVNLRDGKNNILLEHHLSYDSRNIQIPGNQINEKLVQGGLLQLCVLAKNSEGIITGWYESQCENLPTNFNAVKAKYNEHYNYPFTILTSDKRVKLSSSSSLPNISSAASADTRQFYHNCVSIYFTMIITVFRLLII